MKKLINKLLFILPKSFRKKFIWLLLFLIFTACFEAVGISVILPFIAIINQGKEAFSDNGLLSKVVSFLPFDNNNDLVLFLGILMAGVFLLKNIFMFFAVKFQAHLLHTVRINLSHSLFKKYMDMSYLEYVDKNVAGLIHNATGHLNSLLLIFLNALLLFIADVFILIFILSMLLVAEPAVTIFLIVFIVALVFTFNKLTRKKLYEFGKVQHESTIGMYKTINEGLSSFKETHVLEAKHFFLDSFKSYAEKYKISAIAFAVYQSIPRFSIEMVFVSGIVGIVFFINYSNVDPKTILPVLAMFALAFFRIMPSLNRLTLSMSSMRSSQNSLDVVYKEFKCFMDSERNLIGKEALPFEQRVTFQDISFTYAERTQAVLDNVSITIERGETVGIVGKSGSGKTTLIDIFLGLISPKSGDIKVDGTSIYSDMSGWRKLLGYVPQSIYLIDGTISENVAFGINKSEIDTHQLLQALEMAQLTSFIEELPEGLETVVGDKGVKLSGGQRQRIGIARVLYHNPEILVLDEATSALDAETEESVTEAIYAIGKNKTMILIAHRLCTLKNCDRLILLDKGKVVDSGTYDELYAKNEWFKTVAELNNFETRKLLNNE